MSIKGFFELTKEKAAIFLALFFIAGAAYILSHYFTGGAKFILDILSDILVMPPILLINAISIPGLLTNLFQGFTFGDLVLFIIGAIFVIIYLYIVACIAKVIIHEIKKRQKKED